MKKTILSILLALASASPVLAAQVVPPGQQAEQQQQDPGFDQIKLISVMTMSPVYHEYKKDCEDGGGTWTQGTGKTLGWACRNSAGKFGIDGLPPGQKGTPLTFLMVTDANKATKTLRYSVYLNGAQVNVVASLVKAGTPNNGNGDQR